ncbi:flagellin [Nitrosophilus alvini]|uniref:flagellin N-terminal helical domain-containing protein n=1 Tax=Nitrosophilus alvini TaxID=2714855 RepID=UPI00190BEC0D|nr:flagellin [Nitrosophilus alvini]
MRVPEISLFNTFTKYDQIRQKEIEKYTQQLSSGKKILKPSDSTVDLAASLRFKSLQNDLEGYAKNMDYVQNTQSVAEGSLNSISETAQEARVEIVRLLNTGVLDQEDAAIVDEYLQSLKDYIINQANIKIGDSALFGGVKSQVDPFTADGTYQGETVETTVPVSKGVELNSTFRGDKYLGVNENTGKIAIVEVLDKISEIINSGDLTRLHNPGEVNVTINGKSADTILDAFDLGLNAIMQHRSLIGSQGKTLEDLRTQNESLNVNFSELISKLEDADYTEAITNLEKAKTAYEATMASFAQNKDLSLLKYFK